MKRIALTFGFMLICTILMAQNAPMKLGKVELRDLEMEFYPNDSSADIVILCDYGKLNEQTLEFSWLRRIKVLTKEGLNSLIFKGPSSAKSDVRGFVMNLVDGEIVKEKISKDHIYLERITENYTTVRIAPPNAREGSIIDLEFRNGGLPWVWQFQLPIPVRHSELIIPETSFMNFRFQQIGYEFVHRMSDSRYIAKDLPAFHAEPFIDSRNNYMSSLLTDINMLYFEPLAASWESVNDYFLEHRLIGKMLDNTDIFLNKYADSILALATTKEDMIGQAFHVLHDNVSWNGVSDLYPVDMLRIVWDDGLGTSADMNFIFLSLMGKLNIECYPLIISQRPSGKVNPYWPTINRFNYLLVAIPMGDSFQIVDASDKYSPPGYLPSRSINGGGLLVSKDKFQWVEYTPDKARSKKTFCTLTLNEKGALTGSIKIKHKDYEAISMRRSYDKFTSVDDYLENFETEHKNYYVNKYRNDIEDSDHGDVLEELEVEISGCLQDMGDILSLHPVVFECTDENPFKLEDRQYPVDFTTKIEEIRYFTISLPEGLVVEQLPESVSIKTESNSASFKYQVSINGPIIQVMVSLNINKPIFVQGEYQELKALFDALVQKEMENIILKRVEL